MGSDGEGCFAGHQSAKEVEDSILCIRKFLGGGGLWEVGGVVGLRGSGGGEKSSARLHVGLRGSEGIGWEVKERDVSRGTSLQRRWKIPSFASGNFLGE